MLPPPKSFVSRNGTVGEYEVRGWRYAEEDTWHLKVRLKGGSRYENSYLVRDGEFDSHDGNSGRKNGCVGLYRAMGSRIARRSTKYRFEQFRLTRPPPCASFPDN